jgi:hypothetical protein
MDKKDFFLFDLQNISLSSKGQRLVERSSLTEKFRSNFFLSSLTLSTKTPVAGQAFDLVSDTIFFILQTMGERRDLLSPNATTGITDVSVFQFSPPLDMAIGWVGAPKSMLAFSAHPATTH